MGANRQQRRQQEREQVRKWRKQGEMNQVLMLTRNGITQKDLQDSFDKGWKNGYEAGANRALKVLYSACVFELLEAGNSKDEAISFLKSIDNRMQLSIDADEDIEQVLKLTGVQLELRGETLERVRRE